MQKTQTCFRKEVVSKLLRPAAIKQAHQRFIDGKVDAAQLHGIKEDEIARVIAEQRALGLWFLSRTEVPPRLMVYGLF